MMEKDIKIGVVVVVKDGEKVLLGRRLGKVGSGQWGLPGGHLEYGESLEAGARRELMEETGLEADYLKFINIANDPRDRDHWIHLTFLAEGVHGAPQNREPEKCAGWEWFMPDQLPEPLFFGHAKSLHAVLKGELFTDR